MSNDITPKSRTLDWASEVSKSWGPAFYEPDVAYRFSNNREFKSTDSSQGGVYGVNGSAIDQEQQDAAQVNTYPDLLLENFARLLQE